MIGVKQVLFRVPAFVLTNAWLGIYSTHEQHRYHPNTS